MAALEQNINQAGLTQLARREHFTFFGLTLPYLVLVGAMIIIPIGWLFFLSFIGRDGSFSFENYERMMNSKAYIRIFITTFKISILCLAGLPAGLFHVADIPEMGQYLHDRRVDPVLDKPSCTDLCMAGAVAEERPRQQCCR